MAPEPRHATRGRLLAGLVVLLGTAAGGQAQAPARGEPDRVGRIIIEGNSPHGDRVVFNQLGPRPGAPDWLPARDDGPRHLARLRAFDPVAELNAWLRGRHQPQPPTSVP